MERGKASHRHVELGREMIRGAWMVVGLHFQYRVQHNREKRETRLI